MQFPNRHHLFWFYAKLKNVGNCVKPTNSWSKPTPQLCVYSLKFQHPHLKQGFQRKFFVETKYQRIWVGFCGSQDTFRSCRHAKVLDCKFCERFYHAINCCCSQKLWWTAKSLEVLQNEIVWYPLHDSFSKKLYEPKASWTRRHCKETWQTTSFKQVLSVLSAGIHPDIKMPCTWLQHFLYHIQSLNVNDAAFYYAIYILIQYIDQDVFLFCHGKHTWCPFFSPIFSLRSSWLRCKDEKK